MNLRQHIRALAQAPETIAAATHGLAALLSLPALLPLATLVAISAPTVLAQPTTSCRREATNRDPLSGAEAWAIETCTTTDRVTGALIKTQTCTTNRRYATTECVDQLLPQAPASAGPANAPQPPARKPVQKP